MSRKLTLEFIKEEYAKRNYVFLDDLYKNKRYPHNIKCHCGYEWKQRYDDLQRGCGCPKCACSIKHTLEFIKSEYSKRNYVFLDDFYKNSHYRHTIKCSVCNHTWKQPYVLLQSGHGCPKCAGNIKHSLEFIKQEYAKKGYEFLDDFYKNNSYKHNVKCLICDHVWKQRYVNSRKGQGCPRCLKNIFIKGVIMKILNLTAIILILVITSFFAKTPLDGLFAFVACFMGIMVFVYSIVGEE